MKYWSLEKGEHYRIIVAAMRAKLEQNPKVKQILLSTGTLILLPDHYQEENPPGRVALLPDLDGAEDRA